MKELGQRSVPERRVEERHCKTPSNRKIGILGIFASPRSSEFSTIMSPHSATIRSASCVIFSSLMRSCLERPMLRLTISRRLTIRNGQSRSRAHRDRSSEWYTAISTSTDGHGSRAVEHRLCAGVHPPPCSTCEQGLLRRGLPCDVSRDRHYF